ncbi:hypothetical protein V5738_02985 [Salinisphaera sp. SPP-AMP-43]|uniref:hypothetical protein n=1 Tax=Salinisphaera sp. SPP-AMP-43 TaxID=3121288 RepID=UPI003C6E427F
MTPPGQLRYHHDRADLRGIAVLVWVCGLILLAISLPIVYNQASPSSALISTGVAIAIWLLAAAVYTYRAGAARGQEEVVRFDDSGFDSRLFGRVAFTDIQDYKTGRDTRLWRWECNAPSLQLALADRRRLRFHLDARHYRQDLLDFVAFIEAALAGANNESPARQALPGQDGLFGEAPVAPARNHPATAPRHTDTADSPARSRPASASQDAGSRRRPNGAAAADARPEHDRDTAAAGRMSRANRDADRRFRQQMVKHRKWIALAAVLLPLSYAIRACDPGTIQSMIAPGPLDDIQQHAPEALDRTTGRLQRAIAEKGPVYRWGNVDSEPLKPVLAPNINARNIGIDMLDMINTAGDIQRFLTHGEAEGYRMGLQHDGTVTLASYSKISQRPLPGEHTLYFFLLPPQSAPGQKPAQDQDRSGQGRPSAAPEISWRIRYQDTDDIAAKLDQFNGRLPMPIIARWLQMTPQPRLVVTSSRYHGMTSQNFTAAVEAIKADFEDRGIDTTGFESQRFDDGTVELSHGATATGTDSSRGRDGHH